MYVGNNTEITVVAETRVTAVFFFQAGGSSDVLVSGLVHKVLEHSVQVGLARLHAGLAHVHLVAAKEKREVTY